MVKANRSGKRARLGRGLSKFTKDNGLEIGDRLKFSLVNAIELIFQVNVLTKKGHGRKVNM